MRFDLFLRFMWDWIVLVPYHCVCFSFPVYRRLKAGPLSAVGRAPDS